MSNHSIYIYRNFKTDDEHIIKLKSIEIDTDIRDEKAQMIFEEQIDDDSKNDWFLDDVSEGNIY